MDSGRRDVAVHAEGGRDGVHHLVRGGACLAPHEGIDVRTLVIRTGVDPASVRADRRCPSCWEAFGDQPAPATVQERLTALGRQQSLRRRWPGRLRRAR